MITIMTPEMFKAGNCEVEIERSFMNTTQDESAYMESPCKFSASRNEESEEIEDLDVSLSSLGLDFV